MALHLLGLEYGGPDPPLHELLRVGMGQYGAVIVSPRDGFPTDPQVDREHVVIRWHPGALAHAGHAVYVLRRGSRRGLRRKTV
ncbi:MAG: hypothetical protein ACOC8B_07425 [Gemmatimonadota bacterium]